MATKIEVERVDSIPMIVETLKKMKIQEVIDKHHKEHGHWQGLSTGWLALVFLTYILSEESHKMVTVESWARAHRQTLERVTGQKMRRTDFTDDRIGKVLHYLSKDSLWLKTEEEISQHSIRVYEMDKGERVRLDATVGGVYHEEKESGIFKMGRNKKGGYEVQFKIMLGTLDPMGMVIGADVVSGEKADDPLYVPLYKRIRKTLGKKGKLYVGDSKMGALETRAEIEKGEDYYLMPLAMVGKVPELLDEQLEKVKRGEIELGKAYLLEDIPTQKDKKPDPSQAIAEGFEIERQQESTIDGEQVIWKERLFIIRSKAFAETQIKNFEAKLDRVEAKIMNLTPPPARGKKQIKDEKVLEQKIEKILKANQVTDYFNIKLERQSSCHQVRGYGGKVGRIEENLRYQVHLERRQDAIEQNKLRLGWRVYATNDSHETQAQLSLNDVVLAYRGQYLVEKEFARLKGSLLKMLPLYVRRDDHALGLIRLLTLALRTLTIIEFVVRRSLAQKGQQALSEIYQGNPKRKTYLPSVGLLLSAFNNISLVIQYNDNGDVQPLHLTPLNPTQQRILHLLGMSTDLYTSLLNFSVFFPFGLPLELSVGHLL